MSKDNMNRLEDMGFFNESFAAPEEEQTALAVRENETLQISSFDKVFAGGSGFPITAAGITFFAGLIAALVAEAEMLFFVGILLAAGWVTVIPSLFKAHIAKVNGLVRGAVIYSVDRTNEITELVFQSLADNFSVDKPNVIVIDSEGKKRSASMKIAFFTYEAAAEFRQSYTAAQYEAFSRILGADGAAKFMESPNFTFFLKRYKKAARVEFTEKRVDFLTNRKSAADFLDFIAKELPDIKQAAKNEERGNKRYSKLVKKLLDE